MGRLDYCAKCSGLLQAFGLTKRCKCQVPKLAPLPHWAKPEDKGRAHDAS